MTELIPALKFQFDGIPIECCTCSKCGGKGRIDNYRPDNGKCWKCNGVGFIAGKTTLGDWHNYYRRYRGTINPKLEQQMSKLGLIPPKLSHLG